MRSASCGCVVLSIALVASGSLRAQRTPPPPFSPAPLAAQAMSGAVVAGLASWGLAVVGAAVLGPQGGEDPGVLGAMTGFAVGVAAGSALGVHLAARGMGLPVRYWEALAGSVSGTLALGLLHVDPDAAAFWALVYGVPTVGAVVTSSLAASSRVQPVVRPAADRVDIGVAVSL